MGYPAGIGPEIISESLASPGIRRLANFLIIGDEPVFRKALKRTQKRLNYRVIERDSDIDFSVSDILFFALSNISGNSFSFGKVLPEYGRASISYINKAVSLIQAKKAGLLITGPIHKHAAELSGFKYSGHTEYLAYLTKTKKYAMMLTAGLPAHAGKRRAGPLKVILATTHIPIKDVSRRLRSKEIADKLLLADYHLMHYNRVKRPKIAVCGLNPHAGDSGLIGDEEKRIIIPAIKLAKAKGLNIDGPLAADGLFYDLLKGGYDAVLCMYHDQGLVALKMIGRNRCVNITLGLPFIRTSPGHGTALNIAGYGKADSGSMKQAIREAVRLSILKKCIIPVR
jgi:4-hydroxythreonine-4-phosphate dehydrogenase